MPLKKINPTHTQAWNALNTHFETVKNLKIKDLFREDPDRKARFTIEFDTMKVDLSRNRITPETRKLLLDLAPETDLSDAIEKYFTGDKINETENRAVLHTALRYHGNEPIRVDGEDVMPEVRETLSKIKTFTESVVSGKFKGFTGKPITDVVNIGIGGSDLGPRMVVEALRFYKNHLNVHFMSNIDGDHVHDMLQHLNPETTLFVVVSKSFTTQETLSNAETVKKWFLKKASQEDIKHNFVAVSTNIESVKAFGIDENNIFTMWDWVGGRYSLWSAVGLSISLSLGFERFDELLRGAEAMDKHFRNADFEKNIPVNLALTSIWYNNFFGMESEVVIPYTQYLEKFPPFLQQLSMESNGKSIDRNGNPVSYQTGNIIWGNSGTNVQHAFMQLVHQGTKIIPVDFIGFEQSLYGDDDHHKKLMANFYAQAEALCDGKTAEEVHLDMKISGQKDRIGQLLPYKVFEGNRPSNAILIDKLSPYSLGMLIAMYEHKTFVQGVIWNIYSFDQFGVQLGKELANRYLS